MGGIVLKGVKRSPLSPGFDRTAVQNNQKTWGQQRPEEQSAPERAPQVTFLTA
jgi:hypothetical protein